MAARRPDLPDVARRMHALALALAIGGCVRDIGDRDSRIPAGNAESASPWPAARAKARRAALLAARQLRPPLLSGRAGAGVSERASTSKRPHGRLRPEATCSPRMQGAMPSGYGLAVRRGRRR